MLTFLSSESGLLSADKFSDSQVLKLVTIILWPTFQDSLPHKNFEKLTIQNWVENLAKKFGNFLALVATKQLFMNPVGIYLLKVNHRDARTRYGICSKLTIKTPERRQWRCCGVFTVNFEHISQLVLVFLLLTLSR